jgi:competence protein ComEA
VAQFHRHSAQRIRLRERTGALLAAVRLDPGNRAAAAVGLAAALVAAITALWVLSARPRAQAVRAAAANSVRTAGKPSGPAPHSTAVAALGPTPGSAAGATAGSTAGPVSAPGGEVVVDVAGKVRRPGLVRVPNGARVYDAVVAAGGALPGADLTAVNLAARVSDGEQILVGLPPPAAAGGATATLSGPRLPVDLNTATAEELQSLPGVGPVLAQHILDWRTAHGRFSSPDQLQQVSGIGPAKFATVRPLVTS